jgi:acetyl esterase/lipase
MTRFICMNGIFLTSLLLQSCIVIGMIHDVEAHVLDQKRLSSTEMMMETPKNIEKRAARISTSTTAVCYDAEDTRHIRLWNGRAPHALGNNPCKDIPFMWVFMPKRSAPHTDVSIIIMPGGGYDKLTDVNEQLPVARYFADELGKQIC